MFGALDISTSGMVAQRTRLTAIASNLANRNSINVDGSPYQAKRVYFQAGDPSAVTKEGRGLGVHVATIDEDTSAPNYRFDPTNPLAMKSGPMEGYVRESNVNPVVEQVNMMQASRAYEANAAAAEATRIMFSQALRLLA
jgi:flagellar basal-body rod protein FlgC